MLRIETPYLLLLGNSKDALEAKTACGIAHWRPQHCAGQLRFPGCKVDLGLPEMSIEEACRNGVKTLVLGMAPPGGAIDAECVSAICTALDAGLNVASGLHTPLRSVAEINSACENATGVVHEVRHSDVRYPVGSFRKRRGKRLLTVGTDCCVGKMFTTLALERAMLQMDLKPRFRATGQTGILISGSGIPIDAITADFMAGAVETLSPDADDDHWDLIEGQGSLFHPAYAGVSLALLHGSQPDAIVVCHDAVRSANSDFSDLPLPSLQECVTRNLEAARLTNPAVALAGISLNTSQLSERDALAALSDAEHLLGVPAVDPTRTGVEKLARALIEDERAEAS